MSKLRFNHHLRVDRDVPVLIVLVLHFFVGHKLQRAVTHAEHSRYEALQMYRIRLDHSIHIQKMNMRKKRNKKTSLTLYSPRTPSMR